MLINLPTIAILCCLLFSSVAVQKRLQCQPFGLRLALGRMFHNSSSPETISIWFNTNSVCKKSYTLIQKTTTQIQKVYCSSWKTQMKKYHTFIHKCSITSVPQGSKFEYMAFGWSGKSSDSAIPFERTNIVAHVPQGKNFKMVNLADWSYLDKKKGQYTPLDQSFNSIIKSNIEIDALFINGDIAYDLDSNEGVNYENFLIMLSQVGSRWPTIINTGNHQRYSADDTNLLNNTFETYDNVQNLHTTLNLDPFYLLMYDPFHILYENTPVKPLLDQIQAELNHLRAQSATKPIIASSHYPLVCSGKKGSCVEMQQTLRDIYELFIQKKVTLYLGAHWHSYQRLYPYIGKGKTQKIEPPYTLKGSQNYLLSILEGIAGNDKSIVESYSEISPVTAALSYNITGYGILTFNETQFTYEHFTNKDYQVPVDQFTAYLQYGKRNLKLETQ